MVDQGSSVTDDQIDANDMNYVQVAADTENTLCHDNSSGRSGFLTNLHTKLQQQRVKSLEGKATDGNNDIAKNMFLEKYCVGTTGRVFFQKILVRSRDNKKTTTKYDPDADAPDSIRSILPSHEEQNSRPNTKLMLVVGVILGTGDPFKYSDAGTGAKRIEKTQARQRRGILNTDPKALRVVVEVTDFISETNVKYYVACRPSHGLCDLRVINKHAIFFFPEYWTPEIESSILRRRAPMLGHACKTAAACTKKPTERSTNGTHSRAGSITSTTSSLPTVIERVDMENRLAMQWSLYQISGREETCMALVNTLKSVLPELKHAPGGGNEGIKSFCNFDQELSMGMAALLLLEVKDPHPNTVDLTVQEVVQLHASLRNNYLGTVPSSFKVGFFLELCQTRLHSGLLDDLDTIVRRVMLDMSSIDMAKFTPTTSSSTVLPAQHFESFASSLRLGLLEVIAFLQNQAQAIRDQHGEITELESMDKLKEKIGNCEDKASLRIYEERVIAIHAHQSASGSLKAAELLQDLVQIIGQALEEQA